MDGHDRLTLPSHPQAALQARRHLHQLGHDWPSHVLDDTVLATSELVSNAVQHGTGDITLVVATANRSVRVEVHDHGDPIAQTPRSATDHGAATNDDENGRGLVIVEAITARWGITNHRPPPGKSVWFELDLTPPTT